MSIIQRVLCEKKLTWKVSRFIRIFLSFPYVRKKTAKVSLRIWHLGINGTPLDDRENKKGRKPEILKKKTTKSVCPTMIMRTLWIFQTIIILLTKYANDDKTTETFDKSTTVPSRNLIMDRIFIGNYVRVDRGCVNSILCPYSESFHRAGRK